MPLEVTGCKRNSIFLPGYGYGTNRFVLTLAGVRNEAWLTEDSKM